MTDLPDGTPFHEFDVEVEVKRPTVFYAAVLTKDMHLAAKAVTRLVLDRARAGGYNPRHGVVELKFTDAGCDGRWILREDL